MKTTDLRELSSEELAAKRAEVTRELWKARFSNHTGQLEDTDSIRKMRRDVARIKTLENERKRQGQEG